MGQQYSFVEIDHEIVAMVIFSLPLIQEGQLSVSGERMCTILVNRLEDYACPVNVWLGKQTALKMTLGHRVDWAIKPQHKQITEIFCKKRQGLQRKTTFADRRSPPWYLKPLEKGGYFKGKNLLKSSLS